MIVPIVKKLNSERKYKITVLGLTTAGLVLEKNDIPYISFKDIIQSNDVEALEMGRTLSSNMPEGKVSKEETIAYMGLSYFDLVTRLGKNEAEKQYLLKGRQAFFPITIMERFLSSLQPDLVVATNSPRTERAAIEASKKLGIPSICLIDLFGIAESEWIAQPQYAHKLCVLNEHVKKLYIEYGRDEEEIVVTGNPAFDRLGDHEKRVLGLQLKQQKWPDKKVALWASQTETGNEQLPREIERQLIEIVRRREDLHLIIRFHPNENIEINDYYEHPRVTISKSSDDLAVLLNAVDVLITMTSTVGLEAHLLGVPVVTVEMSVFAKDAPYAELGISSGIDHYSKLEEAIDNTDSLRMKNENLSKATDNVIMVIKSMLN
jgi:hypothetical protein